MRLCELASVKSWLPCHPTVSDPLWQRETLAVSEGEIQLFYARCSLMGSRQQGVDAIDALQAAVIVSSFEGELTEVPGAIIMHEPPVEPFLVDELVDGLVKLHPARRQACLFALEASYTPEAVTNLTWKAARNMSQVKPLCLEILLSAAQTRHLKLPYVFWEWATQQIATPLLELQWSIETAFDCTWPQLVQRHKRMIMLNRGADAASLLSLSNI